MKKVIAAAAGLAIFAAAIPASAQLGTKIRQANQERRIDAGVRSGKLTPHEAGVLKGQQESIKHLTARLKARHGGHLTAYDKRLIRQRQDAANRRILMNKRNAYRGRNHLHL